jgi:hypothetical protein
MMLDTGPTAGELRSRRAYLSAASYHVRVISSHRRWNFEPGGFNQLTGQAVVVDDSYLHGQKH